MLYTYQYDGTTYTVNLERQPDGTFHAKISDETGEVREYAFTAQEMTNGWQLMTDEGRVRAYTAVKGDARFVNVEGETYELRLPDARAARKRRGDDHSAALTAQMPGQVRALLVAVGDEVERGQTLVVLEAMKMEIRVAAPGNGKVSRVNVREGDVVERGQTLVEIEQ